MVHRNAAISVRQFNDGVELAEMGKAEVILHGELTFYIPKSCKNIELCYSTKRMPGKEYLNNATECHSDSCFLQLKPKVSFYTGVLHEITQGDTATVKFNDKDKEYCPLQTLTGSLTLQIIETSAGCPVTVVGATLPQSEKKESEEKEEKEEEETTSEKPIQKSSNRWLIPVVAVAAVFCLLASGANVYIIHRVCKARKEENADLPVHSVQQPPNAASKSPAPTSPASLPPQTPPATSTPQPLETEPISPSVATPSREVEKVKRKTKKQRKSRITAVTEPATKSVVAKDVSPPFTMAAKLTEDAPRNLHRNDMLRYAGMYPCQSGSQLDPFLQHIYEIYEPFPARRKVVEWEVKFFLQIVSDAFRELPWLLKNARLQLSSHGAVYSHGRYCSFNRRTGKFISRRTTPGFIAWYAFATKYGHEIKIPDDERFDDILKRLSIPALLIVVFRENIEIETRRSAYKRIRQLLIQVNSMYPKTQLRGMAYPVCLIPALIDKDARAFFEGANDLTYSTPIEVINQLKKYEDSDVDERTDETQPTFSDGKKRDVMGSVEVLGTQTTATTTVKEDLF
uniref:Peptidase_M14 domain-containing protein n=1 Tax=Panagrellus redivivus TaxID=6233 RepID=A0A7E4VYY1_PANRE